MRHRKRLYLVCYDVCGDGADVRHRRVYKAMRAFGEWVQYSVFRCALHPRQLAELEAALLDAIDPTRDQVLIVPLAYADAPTAWEGWTLGIPLSAPESVVRIV